jgi:hypothetical protein
MSTSKFQQIVTSSLVFLPSSYTYGILLVYWLRPSGKDIGMHSVKGQSLVSLHSRVM